MTFLCFVHQRRRLRRRRHNKTGQRQAAHPAIVRPGETKWTCTTAVSSQSLNDRTHLTDGIGGYGGVHGTELPSDGKGG